MSYRIASFNIEKFSRQAVFSPDEKESKKDLDVIAQIIKENAFDIVAIQEITHPQALKELMEKLSCQYAEQLKRGSKGYDVQNKNAYTQDSYGYRTLYWEGRWAKPYSKYGDKIAEGYAFIWNRKRIRLVTNINDEIFEPRIADYQRCSELVRPPYLGRFMPINSRCEFRLINTHIAYEKPAKFTDTNIISDDDKAIDINDVELRKREFWILIQSVFSKFDMPFDERHHDKNARSLVPYTFLLGDYNLNLNTNGTSSARLTPDMRQVSLMNGKSCILTINEQLTTLRKNFKNITIKEQSESIASEDSYLANNYDHFSYDYNKFTTHGITQPKAGRVLGFNKYQNSENETKYEIYKRRISDHLPIYIDIDIKKKNV